MIRATEVLPSGQWDRAKEADTIELPHDGRYRRRIAMRGAKDTVFLLDPADAGMLHDGDGLKLEDGRVVRVIAAIEPVAEITAGDPQQLARIAWHLGNRHVPVQILPDRIRIVRDAALAEQMARLGATVSPAEAPFAPEGGAAAAQAAQAHGHHHHHHHDHGHAHDHSHEHGPDCGCGHDPAPGHGRHEHAHKR